MSAIRSAMAASLAAAICAPAGAAGRPAPAVPPTAAGEPGAFELLDQVRRTYAALPGYRDRGTVERIAPAGDGRAVTRFGLRTAAEPASGGFLLVLEGPQGGATHAVWRDGAEAFRWSAGQDAAAPEGSALAALSGLLGAGGLDALAVPALLAAGDRGLPDPEAATLEGEEPCGPGGRCRILALSRMGGAVSSRLWVGLDDLLIRRIEVRLPAPEGILREALAGGPLPLGGARPHEAQDLVLRVRHEVLDTGAAPDRSALRFAPPAQQGRPAAQAAQAGERPGAGPDLPAFGEEIAVELITVTVRAVGEDGDPLPDLGPGDFRVRTGKVEVPVLFADWIAAGRPAAAEVPTGAGLPAIVGSLPAGRLVVFFFQADVHAVRIKGHLRMLPFAAEILASLHPDDRVAVVSFDSRLKLWRDFTRDRASAEAAFWDALRFGGEPEPPRGRARPAGPSLRAGWDSGAARGAATPEEGLRLTAEALAGLPGEKDLIFLGWGLGRWGSSGFQLTDRYARARRALAAARATVFVLDVTDADFHTLELGLQQVAEDTGGIYAKTNLFPEQAAGRVARLLRGHYVLALDGGLMPAGMNRYRIELRGRGGRVIPGHRDLFRPFPGR